MRQRVLKNKEEINEENKAYIVSDPKERKGDWQALFPNDQPLYLEIGSGKGQFITNMALTHPDRNYIACEGGINIYPRILQKAGALTLPNLMVITEYIINPADYFAYGDLSGVYLNFSDPWKKARYAHRRLTYYEKLNQYKQILKPGSTLEFKTDNDELFDFSLEQLKLADLKADYITRDLHSSPLAEDNIQTEYEQKFAAAGKHINYLRIVF